MKQVRPPAVAGAFYNSHKQTLESDVNGLLQVARAQLDHSQLKDENNSDWQHLTKALIVPHAGYIYSGPTAAAAYALLAQVSQTIKRVVLLGPVHRVPVHGLALPDVSAFATPLGEIQIDRNAVSAIADMPQVVVSAAAHAEEHSLEVQLPFLQSVLEDFQLVPLAVGDAKPEQIAEVLNVLWGGPETLIVISSDLSHFLPFERAKMIDFDTVHKILNLTGPLNHEQACGSTPINGLMLSAKQHGLQSHLLDLCNSGDTAGDKDRVVGYASLAFSELAFSEQAAGSNRSGVQSDDD